MAAQIPWHGPMRLGACRNGWLANETKRKRRAEKIGAAD
jgi:hypothetical protein